MFGDVDDDWEIHVDVLAEGKGVIAEYTCTGVEDDGKMLRIVLSDLLLEERVEDREDTIGGIVFSGWSVEECAQLRWRGWVLCV